MRTCLRGRKMVTEILYAGFRDQRGNAVVTRDGQPLALGPSTKLWNHSPDGYEWGYAGSGPAQLALALLLDATGNKELAVGLHQKYKFAKIGGLDRNRNWIILRSEIVAWVKDQLAPAAPPPAPEVIQAPPPAPEPKKTSRGAKE